MQTYQDDLIDAVIAQIEQDVDVGDFTAIEEMLKSVEPHRLAGYLNEEVFEELKAKWQI